MIEPASASTAAASPFRETHARKVFRMTHSERMAGSVPVWETPRGAQQRIEQTLTTVVTGDDSRAAGLNGALAYQNTQTGANGAPLQEFGFGDLVDMVNPLQQLPVIGHIYREITGDTIKPISQIVGGALYGGPLGAAIGLTNAIIREETGQDLTGNALALAQGDVPEGKLEGKNETPGNEEQGVQAEALAADERLPVVAVPSAPPAPALIASASLEESPETRLTRAVRLTESEAYQALPPALMGFADIKTAAMTAPPERPAATNGAAWRRGERYND